MVGGVKESCQVGLYDLRFLDTQFNFRVLSPFLINKRKKKWLSWDSPSAVANLHCVLSITPKNQDLINWTLVRLRETKVELNRLPIQLCHIYGVSYMVFQNHRPPLNNIKSHFFNRKREKKKLKLLHIALIIIAL